MPVPQPHCTAVICCVTSLLDTLKQALLQQGAMCTRHMQGVHCPVTSLVTGPVTGPGVNCQAGIAAADNRCTFRLCVDLSGVR